MNSKRWIQDYLTFTKKERIAVLTLLFLIVLVWLYPYVFQPKTNLSSLVSDTTWFSKIKMIRETDNSKNAFEKQFNEEENPQNFQYERTISPQTAIKKIELFEFDPNILSIEDWKRLGIKDKTISIIYNYLNKGGHFYKKEDLQKIYGFSPKDFERLYPYITIKPKQNLQTAYTNNAYNKTPESVSNLPKPKFGLVDINVADTTAFIALPGIGSKLANRILQYREKLGGFYSVDQIAEVYALPDSTFQKIKPRLVLNSVSLIQFNLNTSSKDEMKTHPYIKWNIANAIVEYRNQHGNFTKPEDLLKINIISEQILEKIKPYLVLK